MVAIKPVTTAAEFNAASAIQLRVFCREQGIPAADCHEGLEPFYTSLGYSRLNDVVDVVAGHELIVMHKSVSS